MIRAAQAHDLPALPAIEAAADGMFAPLGIVFPPGPTVIENVTATHILVAGDPPVGFAAVSELDGVTYLEQIAVRPELARQGIGGALLRAAINGTTTLLTFRDVPWNAPWYAKHGFTELPPERWGPGLRHHWEAEIAAGLHELGPRVAMVREG